VAAQGPNIWGACVDGTVRRFDIRMGRLYTDDLHHPVTCVVPTGDGLCVLAACLDNALRLLDKGSGELLATYRCGCGCAAVVVCATSCMFGWVAVAAGGPPMCPNWLSVYLMHRGASSRPSCNRWRCRPVGLVQTCCGVEVLSLPNPFLNAS
jgi:hypothetical protein